MRAAGSGRSSCELRTRLGTEVWVLAEVAAGVAALTAAWALSADGDHRKWVRQVCAASKRVLVWDHLR